MRAKMQQNEHVQNMSKKIMDVDQRDADVWAYLCDVPKMSMPFAVIALILNILIPGKAR